MCNLYRQTKSAAEVADWFAATESTNQGNLAAEIYPGYPGLVVAGGEVRSMVWGFPFARRSEKTGNPLKPKPVNNARSDKLKSFMWRYSFEERRCLIPVEAWAEAEGVKGAKTRTWLSQEGADLFAVAGIWRASEEWGDCYSMIMVDAAGEAAAVHNRMPVLLAPETYETWLTASPSEAYDLCQPFTGSVTIDRTSQAWFAR